MAYTILFPTHAPPASAEAVMRFLEDSAEPFQREGLHTVSLRTLPLRLIAAPDAGTLRADLEVTPAAAVDRMVDLIFSLALTVGADVQLTDSPTLSRGQLWLRLVDDQDRQRLAQGLLESEDLGRREAIGQAMWGVLAAAMPGRDVRWDAKRRRVVELFEVGADDGLTVDEAAWHSEAPTAGDVVAVPVADAYPHVLLWRWFAETHPALAGR